MYTYAIFVGVRPNSSVKCFVVTIGTNCFTHKYSLEEKINVTFSLKITTAIWGESSIVHIYLLKCLKIGFLLFFFFSLHCFKTKQKKKKTKTKNPLILYEWISDRICEHTGTGWEPIERKIPSFISLVINIFDTYVKRVWMKTFRVRSALVYYLLARSFFCTQSSCKGHVICTCNQ